MPWTPALNQPGVQSIDHNIKMLSNEPDLKITKKIKLNSLA
jgi:hypothetical protein